MPQLKFFTQESNEFLGLDMDTSVDDLLGTVYYEDDINYSEVQEKVSQIKCRPFIEYINKFLYLIYFPEDKAAFEEITQKEFRDRAKTIFERNGVEIKGSIYKQWTDRKYAVSRETVFKFAFGLGMSMEETQIFLKKVARMHDFDYRSAKETVYAYCLKNSLGYSDAQRILEECRNCEYEPEAETVKETSTTECRSLFDSKVKNEEDLKRHASFLMKTEGLGERSSVEKLRKLLEEFKSYIKETADLEEDSLESTVHQLYNLLAIDMDKLKSVGAFDAEVEGMIPGIDGDMDVAEIIGDEKWCENVVLNFSEWIDDARISVSTLRRKTKGEVAIERQDIITLAFMSYLYENRWNEELYTDIKTKFDECTDHINFWLERFGMMPLYFAHPFECFIALCLLTPNSELAFKVVVKRCEQEKNKNK